MTELVSSICSDMALIRDKNISLTCETQENIETDANRELFSRLLVNLISNAYRYGKEDGHIWVRLQRKSEMIRLEVEDDGIGIEKRIKKRSFNDFIRQMLRDPAQAWGLGCRWRTRLQNFTMEILLLKVKRIRAAFLPCCCLANANNAKMPSPIN